jgi:hypothetical protein
MSLYRHIFPTLSSEQRANYVRLARTLVLSSQESAPVAEFEMGQTALDLTTGDLLTPEEAGSHAAPLLCGPLGFAVIAGISALPGEDWPAYQLRVLGAAFDDPLEDWLLSAFWLRTDNSPVGAAMRLMYVLDYGVPGDWEAILHGQAEADYMDNGFLWDRVGLMPPAQS